VPAEVTGEKDERAEQAEAQRQAEAKAEEGDVNYKQDSQFAEHMKKKSEALSEFSQSKSIQQQREYLPIFSVKAQLMQIINDNQIVRTDTLQKTEADRGRDSQAVRQ
jgi:HrpA-like RNA helicase